ncbi:putative odorant receptor 85d [Halyomorpha halys]|uniref:putative odorant receptor 85d n=1 Tax=Halyomorpha halys TaxID=286706 RepID=UPI0006D51086|nr:Odorant receptor 133 [Halyomorpha halys]
MERFCTSFLEYFEGDKLRLGFAPQRVMFKVMGCFWWKKPSLLQKMYSCGIWIGIQIVSLICIVLYILRTEMKTAEDFTKIINSLVMLIPFLMGILKVGILHINSANFKAMVDFLESFPHDGTIFPAGYKFFMNISWNLITIACWSINGFIRGNLVWYAVLPWDTSTPTGYKLGIASQLVSAVPAGSTHVMIGSVMVAAVERLRPQISKLKVVFSKLGPNPEDNKHIIKEAVDLHSAIKRGVNLINNAMGIIFMVKVLSLVPLICINAFVITKVGDIHYIVINLLPMSLCVCGELFMFFGSGQILATEMENMDHVCYDNEWYLAPVEDRRKLSIIIECSRKQLTINAYGIAYANNGTLLAVVQQGYSYFLFLHTMADIFDKN